MSDSTLAGMRVTADSSLQRRERGNVLIGGSPLRVVRVSDTGARLVDRLLDGEAVPQGAGAERLVRRLLDGGLMQPAPSAGPFTTNDVTVVVPVRGHLEPGLFDAIGPVRRVLIVDDAGSEPVSAPARNSAGSPIECIRRTTQGGPAAARNTGLAEVDTALVAFVDADCIPADDWLEPLLAQFADPVVAAVAPRIVAAEPVGAPDHPLLARYERVRASLDRGPQPGRVRARPRVTYVPSAALVCRVDVARSIAGFDGSMRVGEDVDFVWRLDEAGHTVRYAPASSVAHRHRTTPWAWGRRRFDYGTSAGPLARRHPGALVPLEASGWSVAAWTLAGMGHPLAAGAVVGATAGMLSKELDGLDHPLPVAAQLAGRGHLGAGRLLAQSLVRPWWPVTVLVYFLVPWRRLRLLLLGASLAPAVIEWIRERPDLDPVPYVALRLVDDVAYSTGVWVGSARARTLEPLLPDLTSWPRPSRYTRWRLERTGQLPAAEGAPTPIEEPSSSTPIIVDTPRR
jgi:mycofactocin system glycosyltransferase